jgi:hypothetical protein
MNPGAAARHLVRLLALAWALPAAAQALDRTLLIEPQRGAAGETRHALVVGNAGYAAGPLRNPLNDARAMARALGDSGFRVILLEDASRIALQRAVRDFGDRIAGGGVGLFYFAGHGMQIRGRNFLVPVNADIAHEDEVEFVSTDVNLVLAKMESARNTLNIVILDACRNNPFARASRSAQAGLAQMDAPTGTFIAFATAPGAVAADGSGEHGVYTKHLLAEMQRPGVPIELMFKQVRNGVMKETGGRQVPWESSSLRGEFAFRPGDAPQTVASLALTDPRRGSSPVPARIGLLRTPLPDHPMIYPPATDVPASVAAFSGAWVGSWDGIVDHTLLVERIEGRYVTLLYSWGIGADGKEPRTPGYSRHRGIIDGEGVLRLDLRNGAQVSYRPDGDGRLQARWTRGGHVFQATMEKR